MLINPEVRRILLKLPGYLLHILFYFIVYIKSEIWGVSGYWSKTHYKQRGQRLGEETPDCCLWEDSFFSILGIYQLLLLGGPLTLEHGRIAQLYYSLNHLTDLRLRLACYYLGSRLKFLQKVPKCRRN